LGPPTGATGRGRLGLAGHGAVVRGVRRDLPRRARRPRDAVDHPKRALGRRAALVALVPQWITHNEPWVVAFLGHAAGVKPPGIRDWPTALRVSHHLLLSHGLAAPALRGARGAD